MGTIQESSQEVVTQEPKPEQEMKKEPSKTTTIAVDRNLVVELKKLKNKQDRNLSDVVRRLLNVVVREENEKKVVELKAVQSSQ